MVVSTVTMDEEGKKRNTDCVYFLASPLTCKKANNCEFRHSEAARMNPRDCWYWIHSNCRNPNCSFRHPPLEGKPGTSVSPQTAAAAPLASTTGVPIAALASKSKTPCYFFSQRNCTKGDKCPFMHGSALPTSTDATSQQKLPKAPEADHPTGNKPLVVLKSVALNVSKSTSSEHTGNFFSVQHDPQPVKLKSPSASPQQEKPQKAVALANGLGNLATANPYKMEKAPTGRKSRMTLFSNSPDDFMGLNERHHDVLGIAEKRKMHSARKQQKLAEYEQRQSNSIQTANERYQNGCQKEALWKNDSSSLENDGSDVSLQGEDVYSIPASSRRRPKLFDDAANRLYKGTHGDLREGFDTRPNHRQPHYLKHQEQQMQHESDFNGTSDYHNGATSGGRIIVRDGQRMMSEGYMPKVDLREHLMKRRRDDTGHHLRKEIFSKRGPSDTTNSSSLGQRCDYVFLSKDPRGRLLSRGVDHTGIKRLRHDGGASPDGRPSRTSPIRHVGHGRSPDRALPAVSPKRHSGLDFARNEARERGRDWYGPKAAPVSNVRIHSPTSRSTKAEYEKENAGFTGPKSLAQIKAEKGVGSDSRIGHGLGDRVKYLGEDSKMFDSSLPVSANQQDSVASVSRLKRVHAERALTEKRQRKAVTSEDFEGPKPLSLLLKEKQKMEPGTNGRLGMVAFKESKDVVTDSNREVEDGEVRDEEDDDMESPDRLVREGMAPVESDFIVEAFETNPSQGMAHVQDDLGSSEDEIGLELGPSISGDEDYVLDDDDDEDDFAKKLGGMYS